MNFFEAPKKSGPYIARSASNKTDEWPFWYVAGPDEETNYLTDLGGFREDRSLPRFVTKSIAIDLAKKWNEKI